MMAEEPEPRPAITKVWAKNFRSIEYAELELDPLTVLVGPNASGKSNLLDIIGFLSDAVRDGLETAINRRGGIDSIGRRATNGRVLGPEIGFWQSGHHGVLEFNLALARTGHGEYRVKREYASLDPSDPELEFIEVELKNGRLTNPRIKVARNRADAKGAEGDRSPDIDTFIANILDHGFGQDGLRILSKDLIGLSSPLELLTSVCTTAYTGEFDELMYSLAAAHDDLSETRLYHIFPNSLREPQKVADSHPLTANADNLASALREMIHKENRFLPDLKHALDYAVPGITDIRVSRAGSFQVVELKHGNGRNGRGSWFDLSYESDGTIRLLAMLTALFQEPSLPLIGLEEPELAIHPGAMAVLAENMVEATLRGQVVVATHSPDLIDQMPVESIRAVSAESGSTKVGRVAEHQLKSIRQRLFSAGEIHSMQGLQPAEVEE